MRDKKRADGRTPEGRHFGPPGDLPAATANADDESTVRGGTITSVNGGGNHPPPTSGLTKTGTGTLTFERG